MTYLIAFVLILYFWVLVDIKKYVKLRTIGLIVCTLVLVLIAGLRYRVGGDSLHYMDIYPAMPTFAQLKETDFSEGYGPLWYLFCAISKVFGNNFVCLQILHAVIVNVTFLCVFVRKSTNTFACLLIYFLIYYLYYNMEILREALAVCVFCFDIKNLIEKRWVRYYFLALIAIGFHYSALILLLLPLIYAVLQNRKANLFLLIFCICVFILFFAIIPQYYWVLIDYFPILAIKLKSYSTLSLNNIAGIIFYAFPFLSFALIYFVVRKEKFSMSKGETNLFKIFLVFLLFGSVNQGLMRLSNYLVPFAIVYMVEVGAKAFRRSLLPYTQLIYLCAISLLCFQKLFYYVEDTSSLSAHTRRYELWLPYESVFGSIRHSQRELIYYNSMYNASVIRSQ